MPYWTAEEEKRLPEMLASKDLAEISRTLSRSSEAVAMKLKRLGLTVPPRNRKKHCKKSRKK